MTERLDCTNCELRTRNDRMCSLVASRTMREMVRIGYDTSSDTMVDVQIVATAAATNPQVHEILVEECGMRLLQLESTQKGYSAVIY